MGRLLGLSKNLGATALAALSITLASQSAKGQSGNYNGLLWQYTGNGASIVGYNGVGGTIVIPSTVSYSITDPNTGITTTTDYPVTSIGIRAFYNHSDIISVTIPNGVTSIGSSAFNECTSLESVSIPVGVTSLGDGIFGGCALLSAVTIPDGVTSLGTSTFSGCFSLNSVTLPNSLTQIGYGCFQGCNFSSITIPASVTSIGVLAFSDCSNLKSVIIPSGIVNLEGTFEDCLSLTSVTIPNSVTSIGGFTFYNCTSLNTINIPNAVANIGGWAFSGCTHLQNVTIGNGLVNIGNAAFADTQLTSIELPGTVRTIGNGAFISCSSLTSVCFEGDAPTDGGSIFSGDPLLSTLSYIYGTSGWGTTFSGVATVPCYVCGVPITFALSPTGPVDQPINLNPSGAHNLALVIHGFTPFSSTSYSDQALMPNLAAAIETRLQQNGTANQWDVRFFDWNAYSGGINPVQAVENGALIGRRTGQQIAASGNYQKVQIIGWSAGAWLANSIAIALESRDIETSTTFLDAYIPNETPVLGTSGGYSAATLGYGLQNAEQYYETVSGYPGVGIPVSAVNHDITGLLSCFPSPKDKHGFPPTWYTYTVRTPDYLFGYQDAFAIIGTESYPLNCGIAEPALQQSRIADSSASVGLRARSSIPVSSATVAKELDIAPSIDSIPPEIMPPGFLEYMATQSIAPENSIAAQALSVPMPGETINGASDTGSTQPQYSPPLPQVTMMGTEANIANLSVLSQGGDGTVTSDTNGVSFSTSSFVWETFAISTTNGINFAALDYSNSAPNDSVVTVWLDGKLVQAIESDTNSPLASVELFPISNPSGMGDHVLSIGLESLDGVAIESRMRSAGFYFWVSQPLIASQSVDTNNNFVLTYEVGAGLNYQVQYTTNLLGQWNNLGGVQKSLTNAIMQSVDAINPGQSRFYRVALQQ